MGCRIKAGLRRMANHHSKHKQKKKTCRWEGFTFLNSTFCINSICHLWGGQPHGQADSSRDSWWVSLLTFGEGYHNYHHTFQRDYRNGPCWYNFDPSKWLIFLLSKFRLASSLHRAHCRVAQKSGGLILGQ